MRTRAALCAALLCVATLASAPCAYAANRPDRRSLTTPTPLICIDPGHGGPFSNANANGLRERTVNLQIGLRLRDELLARGYRVIMTRTTNTALMTADTETWNLRTSTMWSYAKDNTLYRRQSIPKDDLTARTRVANEAGADLFISVHCNGAARKAAKGIETWGSPRDALGRQLARIVQSALIARTKRTDRGTHTADFYVMRWTDMPAILVESAFITNRSMQPSSSQQLAAARSRAGSRMEWTGGSPERRSA